MLVILITLINTAQMPHRACRPPTCYTKQTECASLRIRNVRIVGMACPYFFLGSALSALEIGVLMVGAFRNCVPKPIPLCDGFIMQASLWSYYTRFSSAAPEFDSGAADVDSVSAWPSEDDSVSAILDAVPDVIAVGASSLCVESDSEDSMGLASMSAGKS